MRFLRFLPALVFLLTLRLAAQQAPGLIPQPKQLNLREGQFDLPERLLLVARKSAEVDMARALQVQLKSIGITADIRKKVKKSSGPAIVFKLSSKSGLTAEAYRLDIDPGRINLTAAQPAGLFYGLQTLVQLLPPDAAQRAQWRVPALAIDDAPRFRWRGLHLDVSRHFFPVEFVKKMIDITAAYKLNTFHWHLTDDQGWRIEIKKYPRLTSVGGCRKETQVAKNRNPFVGDSTPHCGFYTQEQVREVVAYAKTRFVTIVPEIEMPGHCLAALAAYPELSCLGRPLETGTRWGGWDDIFCTKDSVFQFIDGVLEEVCALFPGPYIHIGGDEVSKPRWKACPRCQQTMQREGLKNESELQSYFIRRAEKMLQQRGKRLVGWDEILEGGLAPDATVMSWRGESGGLTAAQQGHEVVMTPGFSLYLDFYQGDPATEPLAICCYTGLEKVYHYDPVPADLPAEKRAYVIGCQANIWSEYIKTPEHAEYMAFPRALALAEVAWTDPARKDWADFNRRLSNQWARLDAKGVHYRVPTPAGVISQMTTDPALTLSLDAGVRPASVRYRVGEEASGPGLLQMALGPDTRDLRLRLEPGEKTRIEAQTVLPNGRKSPLVIAQLERLPAPLPGMTPATRLLRGLKSLIWDHTYPNLEALPTQGGNVRILEEARPPLDVNYLANWGFRLNGYLRIDSAGVYGFHLNSPDMTELLVDGQSLFRLAETPAAGVDLKGEKMLDAGLHRFELRAAGGNFKRRSAVKWTRPGRAGIEAIPNTALYRDE